MALAIGDDIGNRYRLVTRLGSGATAEVFAAVDLVERADVALKVWRAPPGHASGSMARFEREARLSALISSAHVLPPLDVGQLPNGRPYLVFKRLQGRTLAEWIGARGRLSPQELAPVVEDALCGLEAAEAQGIVHRDVKPSNLFVQASGRTCLIDFGLSKRREDDEPLTSDGAVLGSLDYMSPEQINAPADVDARSDLYSLGATAFHALAGRQPFQAPNAAASVALKMTRPAPRLHEATGHDWPDSLEQFVATLLARDPTARFQRPSDALEAWNAVSGAQGWEYQRESVELSPVSVTDPLDVDPLVSPRRGKKR